MFEAHTDGSVLMEPLVNPTTERPTGSTHHDSHSRPLTSHPSYVTTAPLVAALPGPELPASPRVSQQATTWDVSHPLQPPAESSPTSTITPSSAEQVRHFTPAPLLPHQLRGPRQPRGTTTPARSPRPPAPLSTTPLTREVLKQLLNTLDHALSHTRYAVSGRAALAVWGCLADQQPLPARVSIVCPAADADVIIAWARTAGWAVYPAPYTASRSAGAAIGDGVGGRGGCSVIGVPIVSPAQPLFNAEKVWAVPLRTVEDEGWWERLERVSPVDPPLPAGYPLEEEIRTRAKVLAAPTLLDQFSRGWSGLALRGEKDKERARWLARMMFGILRKLANDAMQGRGRWRLTRENVPFVVDGRFWRPFVGAYPEALGLLERCGLRSPGDPVRPGVSEASSSDRLLQQRVWTGSRYLTVSTATEGGLAESSIDIGMDNQHENPTYSNHEEDKDDKLGRENPTRATPL
ncbi:hypothetical protein MMYC01_202405 [Madurella mycetomatis]|uniref:Uncharacterized protein n=1 Tax=Madurella mycetomatis TaxID=100816 RepID=A0A175W979_9PEZI|nr:hypothetical protein MMYC01_202405 [Madurella mycetomatis]